MLHIQCMYMVCESAFTTVYTHADILLYAYVFVFTGFLYACVCRCMCVHAIAVSCNRYLEAF